MRNLPIRWKLLALTALFVVGFGTFGVFALHGMRTVEVNGPIYARIIASKDVSADVLPPPLYVIESYLVSLEMIRSAESGADLSELQRLATHGAELRDEYEVRHAFWMKRLAEGELKQALAASFVTATSFFRARDERFVPALLAGRLDEARAAESSALGPSYRAHRAAIDRVVRLADGRAREEEEDAARAISRTTAAVFSVGLLTAAVGVVACIALARAIRSPLSTIAAVTEEITRGKLDAGPLAEITSHDELGTLARAFAIMTRKLRQTIDGLRAKNEELERFTYVVSHDLKSPLITIKGFVGYVGRSLATGDVERSRADLERIASAADKMQHLLDDLLQLSRIGRLMKPPESVPLGDVAREAVGLLAGRVAQRGADVEIAADLPVVQGDRTRLLELVENLLDNALKFTGEQAHPRVGIGLRRDGAEDVFFVKDNGAGIEARFHGRIFELFEKLDQRSDGSGAGLAIAKRVVETHGGRIWVESDGIGRGSTFCFTIPGPAARSEEA
jgi:signal transduction histidine kinase